MDNSTPYGCVKIIFDDDRTLEKKMEEEPTGTNVNAIDGESDIWPSGFYLYLFAEFT